GHPHGDAHDVVDRGPGVGQQHLDVLHRLVGLGGGVAERDRAAVADGVAGLAAHEHVAVGDHDHAHVVAQALAVVIAHLGLVEFAQPLVGHGGTSGRR